MKTVKITFSPTAQAALFRASIDGVSVSIQGGVVTKKLAGDKEHPLQWWVRAAPGTKYSVEITDPPEARLKYGANIDASGQDANQAWFWVDPDSATK